MESQMSKASWPALGRAGPILILRIKSLGLCVASVFGEALL